MWYIILKGVEVKNIFLKSEKSQEKRGIEEKNTLFFELKNYLDSKIFEYENKIIKDFSEYLSSDKIIFLEISKNKSLEFNKIIDYSYFDESEEYIKDLYINLDYFERREIKNRIFNGICIINNIEYKLKFTLEKDIRYIQVLDDLLESGIVNNVIIKNSYNYLLNRMYRLKILSLEEGITLNDLYDNNSVEYIFNFEELENKVELDKYLYFNIEKINLIANYILKQSEENIYLEYQFNINEDFDYIIDEAEKDILSIIRNSNIIKIYSSNTDKKIWKFYKIRKNKSNYFFSNIKIFNLENIKKIISQEIFLNNFISLIKIKDYNDSYFEIEEKIKEERGVKYLGIHFKNNDEYAYDRLELLKSILENEFEYKIRIYEEI